MANVKDLAALARQAAKVKAELASERGALNIRLAELRYERQGLLRQPLNRTDLEDALRADLEAAAELALRDGDMERTLAECRDRPAARIDNAADRALYLPIPSRITPEHLVLYFGPDRILEALQPALARLTFDGAGPALAERRARLVEIDREIAAVTRQREELDRVLGEEEAPPSAPSGPQPGDKLPAVKNHDGRMMEATWIRRQMGDTGHFSEGWHWHEVGHPPEL